MTGPEAAQAIAGLIRLERAHRFDDVAAMIGVLDEEEKGHVLKLAVMVLAEQVDDRAKLAGMTADAVVDAMLEQVGLA